MMQPFDRKRALQRVSAVCRNALLPAGYEGSGRTWKLITDQFARLVNLQTNRRDDLSTLTFTLNIGVFFPQVYAAQFGDPPNPPLQEVHCSPRERIGTLFYKGDHWWRVSRTTVESDLAAELDQLLTEKVVPWLAKFSSPEDVLHYHRKRRHYFEAAIVAHSMQLDEVSLLLRQALDAAPHDLARRGIEIWARDHSLQPISS